MNELLQIYIELLKWDIAVMSQPWMYVWFFVPIICFIPFFLVKWTLLTAPIWLPIGWAMTAISKKK
jgi:hypothetical protein